MASTQAFFADGHIMRAYQCECGWWHLTRRYSTRLPAEHDEVAS